MKPRSMISAMTLALAMSGAACSTEPNNAPVADENTASTKQDLVGLTGNIMMWPAGPIAWNGLVGTWPINVWAPGPIGAIAFDIAGVTSLGLGLVGFPGLTAVPITSAYLGAFIPPVGTGLVGATPFLGGAGFLAPAYGFAGSFAPFVGAGFAGAAFAPGLGLWTGGLGWLSPALTSSALMFTDLTFLDMYTPLTFNVTFTAASAAMAASMSTAALSVFATTIGPGAFVTPLPFVSMAYPIMMPFAGGIGLAGASSGGSLLF